MADNPDLDAFKQRILGRDYFVMDQWQLEELAKVVQRCRVKVISDGISPETLRRCFVQPAPRWSRPWPTAWPNMVRGCVAVIPKGPYVLPYLT